MTNSPEVLASIPNADRAPEKATKLGGHDHCALPSVKTFRVTWCATEEFFTFVYSPPETITKRFVLCKMAENLTHAGR